MFANYRWLKVIAIAWVLSLSIYLLAGKNADAAIAKTCPIGSFCIDQTVSSRMNDGAQSFVFTLTLKNNTNNAVGKLMLRLTTPAQVKVVSADMPFVRHGKRQIRWHITSVVPGETWTVKVRAKSLSMDPAVVSNTAFLFYGGSPWLAKKSIYRLFCQ